jgi:hypothetical protein
VKLDLLIPHLLTPPAATADIPSCRLLETWLARSVIRDAKTDYHSQLFSLLNLPTDTSPAWLSAMADNCAKDFMQWRADPVHFQAGTDHAVLFDSQSLSITTDDAMQLVAAFNAHFAADGLQLHAAHPQRWYIQSQQPLNVKTTSLTQAIGRNVRLFLPTGDDAVRWRSILNEAQMLFYAHAVNQQREANSMRTINGLWLWGEGQRDVDQINYPASIYADEVIARGIARLAKSKAMSVNDWLQNPACGLLVLDDLVMPSSYGDIDGWLDACEKLCQEKLPIIYNALKTGDLSQINLYPADGRCFTLNKNDVRKFWRLRKPLNHWMQYDS